MVRAIANLKPLAEPGTKTLYLSMTFGWIIGELVRRTDPKGRSLGQFVRDERLLSLEEAIRKMTGAAAARLGLRQRGTIRDGNLADLVVFDPATVRSNATYDEPRRFPTGIEHVIVNGTLVVRDGEHTGALPGRVVRGPGWRPADPSS